MIGINIFGCFISTGRPARSAYWQYFRWMRELKLTDSGFILNLTGLFQDI